MRGDGVGVASRQADAIRHLFLDSEEWAVVADLMVTVVPESMVPHP